MPLINVRISSSITKTDELLKDLSAELARSTGKPEKYIMCILHANVPMTYAGSNEPCCYVEIKSIGALKPSQMSESFCNLIEAKTGIRSNRIYICFEDIDPSLWGFNGQTFG